MNFTSSLKLLSKQYWLLPLVVFSAFPRLVGSYTPLTFFLCFFGIIMWTGPRVTSDETSGKVLTLDLRFFIGLLFANLMLYNYDLKTARLFTDAAVVWGILFSNIWNFLNFESSQKRILTFFAFKLARYVFSAILMGILLMLSH